MLGDFLFCQDTDYYLLTSLLNGTDIVPLETATAYVESSIPNLRQYLYEVPVTEKRLEELNYLAYRVKWMDSQDEAVFGTVIEMMKPETLQNIINLSCNMDKFRYLPGTTTEAKLGEYLLKGYLDMTMEEQAVRSNYEWIGKDYIKKPKPNGYRSFHLVMGVPVYYRDTMEYFPVEIQIRTMAMDFWASMEHRICYKKSPENEQELRTEFTKYAGLLEGIEEEFEHYYVPEG